MTWIQLRDDEGLTTYKDRFEQFPLGPDQKSSPQQPSASPSHSAHSHQLPAYLQQPSISQASTPNPMQYSGSHQQHAFPPPGGPHYDDPRMHGSPSAPTMVTPRMPSNYVIPVGPAMGYPYSQAMPHMIPAGAPPPGNFRPHANGHQYMPSVGQPLAAPMMVPTSSQGSYMATQPMAVPHMSMYPAGPAAAYGGAGQPSNGYPSPGRGAPMMMHQGSYQGQAATLHPASGQFGPPFYAAHAQMPHSEPLAPMI